MSVLVNELQIKIFICFAYKTEKKNLGSMFEGAGISVLS